MRERSTKKRKRLQLKGHHHWVALSGDRRVPAALIICSAFREQPDGYTAIRYRDRLSDLCPINLEWVERKERDTDIDAERWINRRPGRPPELKVYRFWHPVDDPPGILKLRETYGLEGYGLYWFTVETVAQQDHHYLFFDSMEKFASFCWHVGISPHVRVKEMLDYMATLKMIDQDLWFNRRCVFVAAFAQLASDVTEKRKFGVQRPDPQALVPHEDRWPSGQPDESLRTRIRSEVAEQQAVASLSGGIITEEIPGTRCGNSEIIFSQTTQNQRNSGLFRVFTDLKPYQIYSDYLVLYSKNTSSTGNTHYGGVFAEEITRISSKGSENQQNISADNAINTDLLPIIVPEIPDTDHKVPLPLRVFHLSDSWVEDQLTFERFCLIYGARRSWQLEAHWLKLSEEQRREVFAVLPWYLYCQGDFKASPEKFLNPKYRYWQNNFEPRGERKEDEKKKTKTVIKTRINRKR